MHKQLKVSPKNMFDQIKKRRQTINIIESEYNLPQKYKSPKTQKKQIYTVVKDIKTQHKQQKSHKAPYTETKKQSRVNSLTPYESDLTPKKLLFYHIDSSQPKQRPLRKIHSISLVDTPKKLNLKKKTQERLFIVQEEKDKQGCKKIASSCKLSCKNYSKPLKLQSNKLQQSMEHHDNTSSHMKSSKKHYSRNNDNYDIYYNQGGNNSSSHLKSSKKIVKIPQNYTHSSSIGIDKQKSSRTLRITRNSRSSNHASNIDSMLKNTNSNNQTNSKNNTKSQKRIKSPRVQQFETGNYNSSVLNEKKLQKMFLKCSLILKTYNTEMQKLKEENDSLRKQNQYLKSSLSQKGF